MRLIGLVLAVACYVLMGAVLVRIVFSWISPHAITNPLYRVCYELTEPLLRPIRNLFPPSGLDFSPAILVLGLSLLASLFRSL